MTFSRRKVSLSLFAIFAISVVGVWREPEFLHLSKRLGECGVSKETPRTRSKHATNGAPGLTRNKKLLGAPGLTTRNKTATSKKSPSLRTERSDATRGSTHVWTKSPDGPGLAPLFGRQSFGCSHRSSGECRAAWLPLAGDAIQAWPNRLVVLQSIRVFKARSKLVQVILAATVCFMFFLLRGLVPLIPIYVSLTCPACML